MTFKCFKCNQEIVFNPMQVGKNGKKIPLDPATELPHDCPMRDKPSQPKSFDEVAAQIKDNHGNEDTGPRPLQMEESPKFVDHTLPKRLKIKTFTDPTPEGLDLQVNRFGDSHKIHAGQYQMGGSLHSTQVWYEEELK